MQRTRNPLRVQILRGFESHRFRQKTLTAGSHGGFFVLVVSITIKIIMLYYQGSLNQIRRIHADSFLFDLFDGNAHGNF